jgi:hypothetical protein
LTWIIDVSELEFITNPVTFRLDGNKGGEVGAGLGVFRP